MGFHCIILSIFLYFWKVLKSKVEKKKGHIVWFYLYEIFGLEAFKETEKRIEIVRDWGRERVWGDEK